MYRPSAFAVNDREVLRDFIRTYSFATIACAPEGDIHLAYAPVVLTERDACDFAQFHLAGQNPVARLADGAAVKLSFMGPHAYISSDWYNTVVTVPTWNYMAVETAGRIRKLDAPELRSLLEALSAQEEAHLLPKPPWTLEKVEPAKTEALMRAIAGFEVELTSLEGKFKLSQDKRPEDIEGVVAALEASGDAGSAAVAKAMRKYASG